MAAAWLIQAFKTARPHGLVIVLASAPTPSLRRTMHRLGVDVYLEKPVTLGVLQREVKAALLLNGTGAERETALKQRVKQETTQF
jgi:DNA-binding NarL/FixJ family response regulator